MKEKSIIKDTLKTTLAVVCFVALAMLLGYIINPKGDTPNSDLNDPILEKTLKANDSIKTKIDELDSIKQYEVREVYTFDDDSTIKLFKRLVRE